MTADMNPDTSEPSAERQASMLFIAEQQARSVYDYAPGYRSDPAIIERHVWSPVSCRHTSWTYRPLVRHGRGGCIVPGSRIRCPFVRPEVA